MGGDRRRRENLQKISREGARKADGNGLAGSEEGPEYRNKGAGAGYVVSSWQRPSGVLHCLAWILRRGSQRSPT